ncbi:MAG: TolC family protein [Opitutaceae bacterium]|nr:TolC family protein [Opitutaceae bacterium]
MNRVLFSTLRLVFTLFPVAAVVSRSSGQEPPARNVPGTLSLEAAIQLALEISPALRAATARVDAAGGRAIQAIAWANPELELGAEDWPVRTGRFSDAKRTIGIAQPLPFPGKRSLDKQIGRAEVRLSETELDLHRAALIRDVKIGFFRVLAYDRLTEVSTGLVVAAASSAVIARKRVEAGAAAYHEQLRAEVLEEQARTDLADVQRDLAAARQSLAALVGRPDLSDAKLRGVLVETSDATLLERSVQERLASHPSLHAAQVNLERAELGTRRARLEPYSDMKVGVAGGRSGETNQSIVQLSVSLPLPLVNRGKGVTQEARANVSIAQAELNAVQHMLQRDWANAARRYTTAVEQVRNYRERILPKATEALQLVQTGFEQGKFDFIDLIDTQRTTGEVRQAYYGKLLEMNVAHAELEALLAGGDQPATRMK